MADNMMRIAGRGEDGLAKSIKTDNAGNVSTKIVGSNVDQLSINAIGVDVSDYLSAYLDVSLGWGTGHFEISNDGGATYQSTAVTFVETGLKSARVQLRGRYYINLAGVTHIKYVVDSTVNAPNSASGYFFAIKIDLPNNDLKKEYVAKSSIVTPTLMDAGGRLIHWVDYTTGAIYAGAGPNIHKLPSGGVWEALPISWGVTNRTVLKVCKMLNGRVVALVRHSDTNDIHIYTSDIAEANFIDVYTYANEGSGYTDWGLSCYGNLVMFAMYKTQVRASTDPLHVFLSKDSGLTWGIIHTAPEITSWHYHDVAIDPYRGWLWYCSGDSYLLANIAYSTDLGVTWNKLWLDGKAKYQATSISPLPNAVLFGSDMPQFDGVAKYTPDNLLQTTNSKLELSFSYNKQGEGGYSTGRGSQHTGVAYFCGQNGRLVASKDGVNYFTLWRDMGIVSGSEPWLHNIFETKAGKLIGRYRNNNVEYIWTADAPIWESL